VRVLALDIGEKRCGVAVSDATAKIAMPLCTLSLDEVANNAPAFRRILDDYEPSLLVCGLPVSLDGNEHQQATRIRAQAVRIADATELALVFVDERFSSSEARKILRESGHDERSMRGKIDAVAASLMLQAYLDAR
jgi:putative Holliday junction resolvase